jgi:outer membrane receptor protein involved in Fe transport
VLVSYNYYYKNYLIDFNKIIFNFLISAFLVFSQVAHAANNADLTEIDLETLLSTEIVTASKIARQVSDSPSAVSIVTSKDIKAYGYRTLAEIIDSLPGLNTFSDHVYTYMSGRSFGAPGDYAGRVMLLIDGHQANDNLYNQSYLGNDGILDTELIERVEYVSGPGSVTYGNGAFYGIINVVTKKGTDYDGAQVSMDAASYQSYKQRATFGKRFDNGADILLSVSGLHSQGQNYYFSAFDDAAHNFGIAENLDKETNKRIFLKAQYEKWSAEIAYVDRVKDDPAASYDADFNTKPANMQDRNGFVNLIYADDLSNSLKETLNVYYAQYNYRQHAFYSNQFLEERDTGKWWGAEAKFSYTGIDKHVIVTGLEYRDDFQQDFYLYTGDIRHSTYMASAYLEDEYQWNKDVKLNLGARADYGGANMQNISPRLALIYSPRDNVDIKGSLSSAFRRPNVYERFYTDSSTQLDNPDLGKEKVLAKELVVEYRPDSRSKLMGSVYYYHTKNVIDSESSTVVSGAQQFVNESKHETKGFDIAYEKLWDSSTRLRASYAWQYATHSDGEWLENSPKNLAKLNYTQALFDSGLHLGVEVHYVGARLTEQRNRLGGYTVTNLTAYDQTLFKNTSVSFSVKNVFDKNYAVPAPTFDVPESFDQNGRNFWVQLTYDFK